MALWTLTAGSEDSGTEWGNALNQYFQEVAQKSSGAAAPTDTRAFMWWMDTTTNTLKMRDSADAAWIEWVYIDPATNEMSWVGPVRVLQNADTITVSHDGTDAYLQWTDGSLIIQTDEGTNTDTLFEVKGKGTGKGKLVLWDQSATNKTTFQTADAQGVDITYTLPTSDGSANLVLSTDGAGELSWATAAGGGGGVNLLPNSAMRYWRSGDKSAPTYMVLNDAGGTVSGASGSKSSVGWKATITNGAAADAAFGWRTTANGFDDGSVIALGALLGQAVTLGAWV